MTDRSGNSDSFRDLGSVVVGATAFQVMGGLVPQMSPFVIAGLIGGLSLSERDAGTVASVEMMALAATAFVIAPVLPRVSYRRAGLLAIVLTLLAQVASIFAAGTTALILLRGIAGIGEGALFAMSLSIVASHCRNPEKIFGYFQLVWALGSVVLFSVGGEVTAAFAHRGVFTLIAGLTLAISPLLFLVPNLRAVRDEEAKSRVPAPLLGVLLLAAIVLYVAVSAGLFAFSGPMGERVGLDTSQVGYILTLSSLVGLAGAAAATSLNVRWGRIIPISAFAFGYAVIAIMLCLWMDPWAYSFAVLASSVLYSFSLPYLFGLAAALDKKGRWAAAAGSANLLGFAVGPIFVGAVIEAWGYTALAAVCVAMILVFWGITIFIVGTALDRRRDITALSNAVKQ